ncbi:ABC transporter substrate-binding protein [Aureimonas jatrophae]|uniref:Peptide/nickel transport system substrate-binding protein n=1 Tax=Aureimonas jatrophae TaxID=1166073 RepID=A0A1H0KKZ5_9HYPH|nr:ABC transporter substrate-binding protein [Aureimonas jatrophae]MBB3948754.1 peptide/nickel transport system substrate-binding protein [Aureimonas jatrophae]SDO56486.1 peptide/nickel transport system substrate-binding protein [Aureimonas jatrophae]
MALLPRWRLALAALVLALPSSLPAGAQTPRDDIRIAMSIEPAGLDPTAAAPAAIGQIVWQNVFQGLTRIDENGQILPQLATDWTVSDEGRTVSFTLREGVRFSNGVAFDASTARFSIDRARGDGSTNPQKQFFTKIQAVETPDPRTLVLRLSEPSGDLLTHLGWPAAVMVEPSSAETNRSAPVGTGPYRLAEWRPGDRLRLERIETYWGPAPALREAEFRFISDPQAQAAALRSGAVDAIPEFGAPELVEDLRREERLAVVIGDTELKVVAGMNERRKPFDDTRVRRALMMAVDRAAVIEGAWAGFGTPIGSHYTPNDPGYVDLANHVPYDPQAAKRLLAEAGYPNGFETTIRTPQMAYATRSAEVLQALLAEIGVTLRIVPTEFPAVWVDQVLKGHDFDMTIVAHAEPLDIGIYARPDYYFGYRNPRFDETLAQAERTLDEEDRLALYGDAQRILADDLPALYLFVMPKLGIWDKRLTGLWSDEPIPANDLTAVRWQP